MKTALILAVLFASFALVGTIDYETAVARTGQSSGAAPTLAAWGTP
ncbi:hypothetical protein [Aromatoleum anaerobium]|uniref:Uncharacterized protein n=1 Tax=Aromatoleum anaerobium TaxID=182180 RepID=A0ABX1PRG5_9RHOO|nr:hypothetical protein [Aromatoleum anaerobium]MCK0507366.1 hypothetical protein [Aromatoleum anaerobium]